MSEEILKFLDEKVKVELASSVETVPEVLGWLSQDGSAKIRYLVAANSRTDGETLSRLSKDTNDYVRYQAIQHPNLPCRDMLQITDSTDVKARVALASNKGLTSLMVLLKLAKDKSLKVRTELARNLKLPRDLQKIIARDQSYLVRRSLAGNSSLDQEVALTLAKDKDSYVKYQLASNPSISDKVVSELLRGYDPLVCSALLVNKSVQLLPNERQRLVEIVSQARSKGDLAPPRESQQVESSVEPVAKIQKQEKQEKGLFNQLMNKIAQILPFREKEVKDRNSVDYLLSEGQRERDSLSKLSQIARKGQLSPETEEKLARHYHSAIRQSLAQNPNLSEKGQFILSQCLDPLTRFVLASNPSLDFRFVGQLSQDPDVRVRQAIASRPDLPVILSEHMTHDVEPCVLSEICKQKELSSKALENLASKKWDSIRAQVARREDLSPNLFEKLARDPSTTVLSALARNAALPQHLRDELATHPELQVRTNLMLNPNLESRTIDRMVREAEFNPAVFDRVPYIATGHPNVSKDTLTYIYQKLRSEHSPSHSLYAHLAASPKLPPSIAMELAGHPEAKVRLALLKNESVTPDVLKKVLASEGIRNLQNADSLYRAASQVADKLEHQIMLERNKPKSAKSRQPSVELSR